MTKTEKEKLENRKTKTTTKNMVFQMAENVRFDKSKVFYKELIIVAKELFKRKLIDLGRRSTVRLRTPMDDAILTLKAYGLFPKHLIALEVFGMNGLWVTVEYAHLCKYLEMWEINHVNAKFAKKFIPDANVKSGDSINAIKTAKLFRNDYNFIVIDNPIAGTFGSGQYCEHFDIFPALIESLANRFIIIMNVVTDMEAVMKKRSLIPKDWLIRRKEFYGMRKNDDVRTPKVNKLIEIYISKFKNWRVNVENVFFIPRNEYLGFLVLVLDRQKRSKS